MCIVEEMSDTFQMLSSDIPNSNDLTNLTIQRDDLMQQIDLYFDKASKKKQTTASTLVLHGPSGAGKSTLALNYARKKLGKNSPRLVARWIYSDTFENLYMNYIQKLLNIFFRFEIM